MLGHDAYAGGVKKSSEFLQLIWENVKVACDCDSLVTSDVVKGGMSKLFYQIHSTPKNLATDSLVKH